MVPFYRSNVTIIATIAALRKTHKFLMPINRNMEVIIDDSVAEVLDTFFFGGRRWLKRVFMHC